MKILSVVIFLIYSFAISATEYIDFGQAKSYEGNAITFKIKQMWQGSADIELFHKGEMLGTTRVKGSDAQEVVDKAKEAIANKIVMIDTVSGHQSLNKIIIVGEKNENSLKKELSSCQEKLQVFEEKEPKVFSKLSRTFKKIDDQQNDSALASKSKASSK